MLMVPLLPSDTAAANRSTISLPGVPSISGVPSRSTRGAGAPPALSPLLTCADEQDVTTSAMTATAIAPRMRIVPPMLVGHDDSASTAGCHRGRPGVLHRANTTPGTVPARRF